MIGAPLGDSLLIAMRNVVVPPAHTASGAAVFSMPTLNGHDAPSELVTVGPEPTIWAVSSNTSSMRNRVSWALVPEASP